MFGNSVFRFNHPQEAEKLRELTQVSFTPKILSRVSNNLFLFILILF